MTQVSITSVVREAILNNTVRTYSFDEIAEKLGVTRYIAKKLYFSFLWFPTEETLQKIKETGKLPSEGRKPKMWETYDKIISSTSSTSTGRKG